MNGSKQEFKAWLWNGQQQLAGTLFLLNEELHFDITSFANSHLQLKIPYKKITAVDEFLVFDLARQGLRVQTKDGRSTLFVLEEIAELKEVLQAVT